MPLDNNTAASNSTCTSDGIKARDDTAAGGGTTAGNSTKDGGGTAADDNAEAGHGTAPHDSTDAGMVQASEGTKAGESPGFGPLPESSAVAGVGTVARTMAGTVVGLVTVTGSCPDELASSPRLPFRGSPARFWLCRAVSTASGCHRPVLAMLRPH